LASIQDSTHISIRWKNRLILSKHENRISFTFNVSALNGL
jgi:hypothetical protein